MSNLIVIRIVPQTPVDAGTFTSHLSNNGGLQITAFDITYGSPTSGTSVGTAVYNAPTGVTTSPKASPPLGFNPSLGTYQPGTGIAQQLDQQPATTVGLITESAYYDFESVATAVIEVSSSFENLRLVAQWGSGATATAIPITQEYYRVPLAPGPAPTLGTLDSSTNTDAWAALPPSLYLSLPAPAAVGGAGFSMPSNGAPPPFDTLLKAIQGALQIDPGTVPDLGTLTLAQCQNIAYEIVWSQQPPMPTPPDPIESLYTDLPNTGTLFNGSSPNTLEGDREQFEAKLAGYYATANASADRLTNFVFSVTAAVYCEKQSLLAKQALLEFPGNPAVAYSAEAEVILTGLGGAAASFGVPAAYFYALAATMPSSMTPTQRYNLAVGASLPQMLATLTSALNASVVTDSEAFVTSGLAAINAAQAARRLDALGVPTGSTAMTLALDATLQPLVTDWLAFASGLASPSSESYQLNDDTIKFWQPEATSQPAAYLELVLGVLTQGNATLTQAITTTLLAPPPPTVASLAAVTNSQWTQFFTTNPTLLPPFTLPGNTTAQIANFIHYFQKFFAATDLGPLSVVNCVTTADAPKGSLSLSFASTTGVIAGMLVAAPSLAPGTIPSGTIVPLPPAPPPTSTSVALSQAVSADVPKGTNIQFTANYANAGTGGGLPLLQAPSTDWLSACLSFYQTTPFTFGSGLNLANLQVAAAKVFTDDPAAQTWLVDALVAIDALYQIIVKAALPISANVEFSVVEALYARGFTSAADVTELSGADFQQALTGTVAFDSAPALYTAAQTISPATGPGSSSGGTFQPINPDGSLTNCIPARCRSPLGPIAYLHEMLQVSPSATCENPLAAPASGQSTLGTVIAQRRGPLGTLAASCANLETPLPLIDIVNECLEFMGAATTPTNGTVYNTSADAVAGYILCKGECQPESEACVCHDPAALLCALPEYSTPGTPAVSTDPLESNQAVEPLVYNNLKADFSSCGLPYSQALDVNRTYLRHFSTCRYEVMRTFRKCITEFVLAPENEPVGFEDYLWRYPVRIDIAIEYLGITPEEYQILFQGAWPKPCGPQQDTRTADPVRLQPSQLYGYSLNDETNQSWRQGVVQLPEFLSRTCLTYCEFLELWKSQFVVFNDGGERDGNFPDCEPCCLENHWLQFPDQTASPAPVGGQPAPVQPNQSVVGTPVLVQGEANQTGAGSVPAEPAAGTAAPAQAAPADIKVIVTQAGTGQTVTTQGTDEQSLSQLAVFIRLWRKLKEVCGAGYSFAQLRDICDVLQLFTSNGLNSDFIRQLAAFQILRDQFRLKLTDPADKPAASAIDAARTQILALWAGESAVEWPWAVRQLIEGIERHAKCRNKCDHRTPEFDKAFASSLDELSLLAGFDPTSTTGNTWQALPTHTLRFAEVLSKIYASHFRIDEVFYLFTAGAQSEAGHVFPLQEEDEAIESPLSLPEDEHEHSLWKLRHKLLEACVSEEEFREWSWNRIEASLREEFGYAAADLLAFGRHFFPATLQSSGYVVDAQQKRYSTNLAPTDTTPAMWSTPPDGPFQYDATAGGTLSFQLPLAAAVFEQMERVQQLNAKEQNAVQDLYFQPRANLAAFAFLFADFTEAQERLIQEREEHERWNYFRRQFALCRSRCHILAEHLAGHVEFATHQKCPNGAGDAFIVMRELFADENWALNWENDSGKLPTVAWAMPNGGAFAALLGLTGTGLLREFTPDGGSVIWRDVCGPLEGFGRERDSRNCPVPTVVPSLGLTLTAAQLKNVSIRNGLAADNLSGAWLGGGQGFTVKWTGALLVDRDGAYEFCAGAPTPESERPDLKGAEHRQWRVTLSRDQKTWVLLNHNWPGQTGRTVPCPHLRRGAYDITVEFSQPSPAFSDKEEHRLHTGFQVKYMGPDSDDRLVEIPHSRLFRIYKDLKRPDAEGNPAYQDLGYGISGLAPGANSFLNSYYTSSLRDIRRTYQRAFKALVFTHRFALSAKRRADGHSELGFLLAHPHKFAGLAYYLPSGGTGFTQHAANFDFNFLPLRDNYYPPTPAQNSRTQPSVQRMQAMFDWWERIFDYVHARNEVRREHDCALWALFDEAVEQHPTDPGYLLRHMGASKRDWPIDLRYYQDQFNAPYSVSSSDLADDRWVVRVWHADRLARVLLQGSTDKDAASARPDLWASLDPSAPVDGGKETGNANLSAFLCDNCFENGLLRRYDYVRKLNDGLRDRGRRSLIAYLCAMDRVSLPWGTGQFAQVARDLSDLLLLDVETGVCEKASRIDEAISSVQNFIRRARLGLESGWPVSRDFALAWDGHFASFHVWQACKRRHLYKENWIEWDELKKARVIEAFRFLETQLRSDALTIAAPGGLEWWPGERPPEHRGLNLLQKVEVDKTRLLPEPREGLNLLATPERDARPSWLTMTSVPQASPPSPATESLPFWMEAAIRLGRRFYRIAAAGVPPASSGLTPHGKHAGVCCVECGCVHPALVDEYYFWLVEGQYYSEPANPTLAGSSGSTSSTTGSYQYGFQDDFYSQAQQQSGWQDPTQLPQMLLWNSSPMVRLAWCRVHNGEFQQPRASTEGVPVVSLSDADLTFLGRTADSLTFSVTNPSIPNPPPVLGDTSAPGLRYDLAADSAVVLPLVSAPTTSSATYPGALPCYPYFVYDTPGTHLFPLSFFSPAIAVARALRAHCSFEAALKWYRLAFDPLQQDCSWVHCGNSQQPTGNTPGTTGASRIGGPTDRGGSQNGACCDSTDVSVAVARNRSIVLHYLETLREWGDATMRLNSPEHFQQARLLFDTMALILGKRPQSLLLGEPASPQTVTNYVPDFAPLNPRLLDLYDITRDRLSLIHARLNARRMRNGHPRCDMPYFGNSPLREGWRSTEETCADEAEWCYPRSPYRFLFRIQKAQEFAAKVSGLGGQLLAAFEKGDAEYLASLRACQERELMDLQLAARQDQWRDADWQVEALQKTKAVSQANLAYYNTLIQNGLITGENVYQDLTIASTVLRAAGDVIEGVAGAVGAVPNMFTGAAGFGGSPLFYIQLPVGQPLSDIFSIAARIMNGLATIASSTAGLELTEASWQRRSDEWTHQTQILTIEIEQIELQILGSQRRRDQALQDLNAHQRQIEQSTEVLNFLRNKFTAHDLYLFLQKETAELYYKMYDLALYAARQAEQAFNLERGHTTRRFIPECAWNSLQEGLMAGERLEVALRHMEKAYLDENIREYELTKHFSLREHFPMEYLRLRTTGYCEIDIPEWMFDLDYPGMYMRRIKNISLTIPCVTGPFNGVQCRLTLLSSTTRTDPRLIPPPHRCCCDRRHLSEYEMCPCDPRSVRQYAARDAIATSSGKNDSGMFELSFRDERYLPFEYLGAVCRLRIELPPENNYFDPDTLSDLILRLNHTAREGGELLRRAANETAQRHLPGDGWCFFDARHDFPDAWELFRTARTDEKRRKQLSLRLTRRMFPYVPERRCLRIDKIALLFEARGQAQHDCCEVGQCACQERRRRDAYNIGLVTRRECEGGGPEHDKAEASCVASAGWPELYYGIFDVAIAPITGDDAHEEPSFEFPFETGEVPRVYVFCHYTLAR